MLYLTRHGQTDWNVQRRICGITDIGLTEKGRDQALRTAHTLADKNIGIIISSPLKRATETSEIIGKGIGAKIIIDNRLTEQNYGIYEGVDHKDEAFLRNKRQFAYKYPGGESMMQVAARVYPLIEEIKADHRDRNVLIVTHGGICRVIHSYFCDMTNEEYFNYVHGNCAVGEYPI